MVIVELLELAQRVDQVSLVPDQRAVQQFAAAGLYPPFHDRVHARHLHAGKRGPPSRCSSRCRCATSWRARSTTSGAPPPPPVVAVVSVRPFLSMYCSAGISSV